MCSSRKYPYPPHGRDFSYDPPSPLDFPKIDSQNGPPLPSGNSVFVAHPLEILSFLVETKNKILFLVQNTEFWSLPFFFREKFGGFCDRHITRRYVAYIKDAYRGICDMQMIDLIP